MILQLQQFPAEVSVSSYIGMQGHWVYHYTYSNCGLLHQPPQKLLLLFLISSQQKRGLLWRQPFVPLIYLPYKQITTQSYNCASQYPKWIIAPQNMEKPLANQLTFAWYLVLLQTLQICSLDSDISLAQIINTVTHNIQFSISSYLRSTNTTFR